MIPRNLEMTPRSFKIELSGLELLFHKMKGKMKASQKEEQKPIWKPWQISIMERFFAKIVNGF